MRSQREHDFVEEAASDRELRLLSEVYRGSEVTQRDLSRRVGVALGLTNLLLRNLAQKGYVRVTRASWRRWLYTLTPEGFSRKIQLTVAYIHRSLNHYQRVRQTLREELEPQALNEESRVAIYGTGEFAELVYLGLKEIGIEEISIFDQGSSEKVKFLGMPVQDISKIRPEEYDRIVVGLLGDAEESSMELRERGVTSEKLITFFADLTRREEI